MRAWVIDEPFGLAALRAVERPRPEPAAGQLLVRMRMVALNYRDLMVIGGQWRPSSPRIPVSDGVGEVVALGDGVSAFSIGDRVVGSFYPRWIDGDPTPERLAGALGGVAADGVLAEYVVFDAESVVRVPEQLRDEEAAALPCAAVTAWHAVMARGAVTRGETVLVQGTGGVALFATQLALSVGASVIATSSSDEKLERMLALGVTHGVNHRRTPAWDARVLELTQGRGVDHVVETVGGDNLHRSLNAVRLGGTVSLVGFLGGNETRIETFRFAERSVRLNGILVGSRRMLEQVASVLATQPVRAVVDRVFAFDEAGDALRHLESGVAFGKVCVRM